MYAIGSLLPLSSSSNGLKLFFRINPLDRKIPNTDAESVDEKVDANNNAVTKLIPNAGNIIPDNQ